MGKALSSISNVSFGTQLKQHYSVTDAGRTWTEHAEEAGTSRSATEISQRPVDCREVWFMVSRLIQNENNH